MLGVQLQINHESLPKERKILSECEARGPVKTKQEVREIARLGTQY